MNLNLIDVIIDIADTDYEANLDINDNIEVEVDGNFIVDKTYENYTDSYSITPAAEA